MDKVITDNFAEKMTIKKDKMNFVLTSVRRGNYSFIPTAIITLNPREMMSIILFVEGEKKRSKPWWKKLCTK